MSLTEEDKQWIREQLERVETALINEVRKWASTGQLETLDRNPPQ